jgi:gephyrin
MSTLKAAILIVSTTASRDPSTDSSGGILKDVFEQEGGGKWEVVEQKIVGDEVLDIQRCIVSWADREDTVNLIISTGGTGFAVHDSTPEVCIFLLMRIFAHYFKAVSPLLHKQAPGLVHGMLAASYAVTPCEPQVIIALEVS